MAASASLCAKLGVCSVGRTVIGRCPSGLSICNTSLRRYVINRKFVVASNIPNRANASSILQFGVLIDGA
jgi:hypothetical protein